jgi:hypothetical protein
VLSNLYLHFVLDLWFEKKIKPQCRGEAYPSKKSQQIATVIISTNAAMGIRFHHAA